MSCIGETSKYILYIFNFLIAACSLVLIVFGIMYFMDEDYGVNVFAEFGTVFSLGILSICIGVVVLFVAGFGCCGAIHENTCLLTLYAVFVIILFALQMALGLFAILKVVKEDDFNKFIQDTIRNLFNKQDKDSINTFYDLQYHFKCCGLSGPNDYKNQSSTPASCCNKHASPCLEPFEEGCVTAFLDAMKNYITIIGYVAIAFAVIELAGAIFSFVLRREKIKNKLKFTGPAQNETSI